MSSFPKFSVFLIKISGDVEINIRSIRPIRCLVAVCTQFDERNKKTREKRSFVSRILFIQKALILFLLTELGFLVELATISDTKILYNRWQNLDGKFWKFSERRLLVSCKKCFWKGLITNGRLLVSLKNCFGKKLITNEEIPQWWERCPWPRN